MTISFPSGTFSGQGRFGLLWPGAFLGLIVLWAAVPRVWAEDPVRLQEAFPAGYQYHVSTRVQLTGTLTQPPMEKDKPAPKPMAVSGESVIDYDERILGAADGKVDKTVRLYRRIDLQRKIGDRPQQATLRNEVRRLVILRRKNTEVPFSPDGPLTWGEIDLIRTDVFTPALVGLLPSGAVRTGDRWPASTEAVQELTDLENLEGQVECRLEQPATVVEGRRYARVAFAGRVRGVTEDGPTIQQLDGYFFFDLESRHLSYLSIQGVHSLLDKDSKDGKEVGRVEGKFTLTRQPLPAAKGLSDEALRGVILEPNAGNTRLLYDNPDLGIRFLYPRRWHVAGVHGRQIGVDAPDGSGLLLTLEPGAKVPTADQFQTESREYLLKQKAKLLGSQAPSRLQPGPQELDRFGLEVEAMGQRVQMDYYVARQANGGATIAARLLPKDLAALQKEVEGIARSIVLTRKVSEK
jgi:hypothetical protein